MRIALCNRDYKKTWSGGDIKEMLNWQQAFRDRGHECEIISPETFTPDFDVYHVFNLSWDWTWRLSQLTRKHKKPMIVSTIYFSTGMPLLQLGHLIKSTEGFIIYSPKERERIEKEAGVKFKDEQVKYLVNGTIGTFQKDRKEEGFDVITVQTQYHARKNLERLSKACDGLRLAIVGTGCKHIPATAHFENLSFDQLNELYNKTKVLAAVGYDDPFSNTIKEGLSSGCNVVYAKQSYCDWGKDKNCFVADGLETQDIKRAVYEAIEHKHKDIHIPTYYEQVPELIEFYESKHCN